jgi:branched-chain amino acid transport system substrate-binding protein
MRLHDRSGHGRAVLVLLTVAALLTAAAACSGDDDDAGGGNGGESDGPDAAEVLGPENPASGDPIKVGFVYDGTTAITDNAAELAAGQAAAEYVNQHLGGIAGRPIELDVCSTDQSPAGAGDCVNQMVADEVPIVVNGVTGQGLSLFPPLAEAGVPVFTPGTGDQESLFTPGIYIMGNGIVALLAGPAKLAADAGVDRAAILVIDVPAASGAIEAAAPGFYDNAGVDVDVVAVPPDTPDMTPSVVAEMENDPGQFAVVGDASFCLKAMTALAGAGFDGQIALISQCIDDSVIEQSPNIEGVAITTFATTDPDSEEFQLYQAVMDTFAEDDADRGGVAPSGYQAVLGFARAMADLSGDVTADSVEAAFAAMPATPMPLADGITYQCDGQQVALAPNVCSTDVLTTTLDADGAPTTYDILPGADLLE